jgi:polyferredoxin
MLHGAILIGLAVCMVNIAVHATIMGPMSWSASRMLRGARRAHAHIRLVLVMIATVTVLMAAHLVEIAIWGLCYAVLDVTPKPGDAFYLAFVNYTTLGYGDILPVEYWRALGPFAAMNGVLLFGWSTAVIFDVLRRVGPKAPQA